LKAPILALVIGGGLTAITIFLVFNFLVVTPTQKYDIAVDPILVKDSMGTETHVVIKNTGMDVLTNIRVDYGGTARPDVIPLLQPGEKISLSPPVGSDLTTVRVTTDQGINITQSYREPASVPFIGNSGYGG